jgi:adenylyl cyclase-associated protein
MYSFFNCSDESQIIWAKSFVKVLADVQEYVKKHQTTGLVWNPKGVDGISATLAGKTASHSKVHVDSPRPPDHLHARPHVASLSNLLQKADLTSGLRKVDKSEMTHKNPELRGSSIVPGSVEKVTSPSKVTAPAIKKTPVTRLDGSKWIIVSRHLIIVGTSCECE